MYNASWWFICMTVYSLVRVILKCIHLLIHFCAVCGRVRRGATVVGAAAGIVHKSVDSGRKWWHMQSPHTRTQPLKPIHYLTCAGKPERKEKRQRRDKREKRRRATKQRQFQIRRKWIAIKQSITPCRTLQHVHGQRQLNLPLDSFQLCSDRFILLLLRQTNNDKRNRLDCCCKMNCNFNVWKSTIATV